MTVMEYRTRDGLADFGFSIEFQPDRGWRVYIIFEPFYCGDEHTADLPYQSIDPDGRRYVNWHPVLDSLGDAKTVAGIWAELAQRYQHAKKEHALYAGLIRLHHRNQEQKTVTSDCSTRPDDAVGAGETGPAHQAHAPVIPHTQAPAQPYSDPPQRYRCVA